MAKFAAQALAGAERAVEAFDGLDIGVRISFAGEIGRMRARLDEQFRRLDQAVEADLFRSIAEEARLLRQDASRLKHRPKLREHVIRADLVRIEAESRQLTAILSQSERAGFAQQMTTAEQALADGRLAVADRAAEAMREVLRTAYSKRPGYAAELFRWLQGKRALSNDPARFDTLVARGRAAAMADDEAELRHACSGIARTLDLPQEHEADVVALAGLRR